MNYEDLQRVITNSLIENQAWGRAISLDIEADLRILDDPTKIILSISTARRDGNKIDIQKFVLNNENIEDEVRIFNEFGSFCERLRPLVFIGYGIGRFDLPVLLVKMRQLDNMFRQGGKYQSGYWAFRDAVTRSYVLDMINPVRFEIARFDRDTPKFISLENTIAHKRFEQLPFMRTKNIVSDMMKDLTKDKWNVIHGLWKNNRESFNKYIEGDVHDTLLLAEELFNTNSNQ